ncbi:MAG: YbhB/YbcL family Raf kinase inhibitor-like protein [Candidatus Promineifilaceae bacterium]|nr:YbhB/YbcL family Raf kinase inhibitor-like protein [Candidatus Promineifilaceae bacterium]
MLLRSSTFEAGTTIPDKYTCDGENVSPPLRWGSVPDGARSLALIVDDPDAPAGVFTHWVLYNIQPNLLSLGEAISPGEETRELGTEGRNDFGNIRYEGPCPPAGPAHAYYFRLYALDTMLTLSAGATRAQLIDAMQGHILEKSELQGLYGRPKPESAAR